MADQLRRARARAREELPSKLELVAMAVEVYNDCREHTFEKNGTEWPQPQHGNALKAIELIGKLCGHLGDGKTMDRATLERELDRLGFQLVAKVKRVG